MPQYHIRNEEWRKANPPKPVTAMIDGREVRVSDCRAANAHSGHLYSMGRYWCRGHSYDRT